MCCTVMAISTWHEPPPLGQLACWVLMKKDHDDSGDEERKEEDVANVDGRPLDYVDYSFRNQSTNCGREVLRNR